MRKIISSAVFLPSAIFPFAAFFIGVRNPSTFDAPALLKSSPLPAVLFLLAAGIIPILLHRVDKLKNNFGGLILSFSFTLGYFLVASILNKPEVNTNNIYFAADSASWYLRLAGEDGWDIVTRAIHPFMPLLFRPLIAFLSVLAGGNRFYTALILLALAGGGSVFLACKIIQLLTGNQPYAVLCASLLGISASHLIFASILETYIFSSFFLLCFIWLMLNGRANLLLIATSVITFGITLTNTVQQALTFLFVRQNIKRTLTIFAWVIFFSVCLNLASKFIYPATEYFFIPKNLAGEQRFLREINFPHIGLVTKNLFVYNIVAPQPYLSFRNEMPRFNFLNGSIQNYVWFGWPAVVSWILVLGLSFIHILRRSHPAKDNRILISMFSCLLFNFLLLAGYGTEPFLYSAGWTYALILIVAIIFQDTARHNWVMGACLFLILLIMLNNLWLLYLVTRKAGEYLA